MKTIGHTPAVGASRWVRLTAIVITLLGPAAMGVHADVLELNKGMIVNGTYAGGTAATVRFSTPGGIRVFPRTDVVALTFTGNAATPAADLTMAPSSTSQAPAQVSTAPATLTVPAGTVLLVRTTEPLTSQDEAGSIFTAKLAFDLMADSVRVAPAGTVVFGKVQRSTQARRLAGRSSLEIRLYQLSIAGQAVPIATDSYREAGASSTAKLVRNAGAGAAIGEVASNDAGRGAAIGAGVAALKRGQMTALPAGTLIEFTLTQPVTVRVPKS